MRFWPCPPVTAPPKPNPLQRLAGGLAHFVPLKTPYLERKWNKVPDQKPRRASGLVLQWWQLFHYAPLATVGPKKAGLSLKGE
jgi:hypothetical protein